jgi:hypothetical protein
MDAKPGHFPFPVLFYGVLRRTADGLIVALSASVGFWRPVCRPVCRFRVRDSILALSSGLRLINVLNDLGRIQKEVVTLSGQGNFRLPKVRYPRLEPKDAECAAKLKKRTLTNLYNERPAWLDLAHKKLDAAVAAAYGWPANLSDEQILEKLLALNLERAAEEAKAAKVKKPKTTRAKSADEMI